MAKLEKGVNDLATLFSELAKEWHSVKNGDLKPTSVTSGSNKKVWWQCSEGHEWLATINARVKGSGCPYCSGRYPIVGETDLVTTHPELAAQWHPTKNGNLMSINVAAGSRKKVWWQCDKGHEWEAKISNRVGNGNGCPYCAGQRAIVGETDLVTTHSGLANQWHPIKNGDIKPTDITSGSHKKVWWQCDKGHEWETSVSNRTNGTGCPYCSGKLPVLGKTDLLTSDPELAEQWHPAKNIGLKDGDGRDVASPDKVTAGSSLKVWWQCKHGHEWEAKISNRVGKGNGCPYCTGQQAIAGETDLSTTHPELAKQWHPTKNGDIKPTDVKQGSSKKKIWWKCPECGYEWAARVSSRTAGHNCPRCSESKGEKVIRKVLEDNHVSFKTQYKFEDRFMDSVNAKLKDDFAIFDKNGNVIGTIEYHGQQHYEPVDFAGKGLEFAQKEFKKTQKRDVAKTKYLQEHGIPQLIIPYWEFDNIEYHVTELIKDLSVKHELH